MNGQRESITNAWTSGKIPAVLAFAALVCLVLLSGCAGDFLEIQSNDEDSGALAQQIARSKAAAGTTIRFHYSDFYSITDPNAFQCAGDAKRFYQPYSLEDGVAEPFETSLIDDTKTIRPSFLKDVSVDLSDSNASIDANQAFSCSFGNGTGVPPTSNCATFDFGALQGIPTTLGGSVVLLGGIKDTNYAGGSGQFSLSCGPQIPGAQLSGTAGEADVNACSVDMYALGVQTLPASAATDPANSLVPGLTSASEPISSWSRVSGADDYSGPRGATGGALAYDAPERKLLLFGGAAPLDAEDPAGVGSDTNETWIFDLTTLKWTQQPTSETIPSNIATMSDCTPNCPSPVLKVVKAAGGRSHFGYLALPGIAINALTTDGVLAGANIDTTDRIAVVGGIRGQDSQGNFIYADDIHTFDPSFKPQYKEMQHVNGSQYVTQWLDSSHVQIHVSAENDPLTYKAAGNSVTNFASVPLRNNTANSNGYVLTLGGFDSTTDTVSGSNDGHRQFSARTGGVENRTGNLIAMPTYDFASIFNTGSEPDEGDDASNFPFDWTSIDEGAAPDQFLDFGGGSAHPGFDLSSNEVIVFGGVNCREYMVASGANCSGTSTAVNFNSTSRYYSLGSNINGLYFPEGTTPLAGTVTPAGSAPARAGMASARGFDGAGNVIVVAWGGVGPSIGRATDSNIYYLYDNGGMPTWVNVSPVTPRPNPMVGGSLVYSHVTDKFYLFGGYVTENIPSTSNETWELSVSGTCTTAGTCTFTWKKLTGSLTCHPNCDNPPARRSHRMVEVNYNNTDPTTEPACTAAAPCSYGIFMEGGTNDGLSTLGDRWMFDPTGNGGRGHWQRVNDFPQRHGAAIATVDYFSPSSNKNARRAVLFGGETGLHSPEQAESGKFFVPPTLGDTHVFDFSTNQWTRVKLLGMGVNLYTPATDSRTEYDKRQSFTAQDTDSNRSLLRELTPPPLAGSVMVTRTFPRAALGQTSVEPLKIPEVFLFGGRKKDGTYLPLNSMYKFCLGSTGENPIALDATCDAFDEEANPNSPSPKSEVVGRWLRKQPPDLSGSGGINPANLSSVYGAGTYDAKRDHVVLFGGITPAAGAVAVTESRDILGESASDIQVYEYTPPSVSLTPTTAATVATADLQNLHGYWSAVGLCSGSPQPTGRYGHSLSYDSLNDQLVVIGGYSSSGTALTQIYLENGSSSGEPIPEIWTAKRDDQNDCYTWKNITLFGNALNTSNPDMPLHGLSHFASIFIGGSGYNTGYYTLQDASCAKAGPIASPDSEVSKLLAGGIYFDIDRSQLCTNENLILHLAYFPFGTTNLRPDQKLYGATETAAFKIHLMKTGFSESSLLQAFQPRHLTYSDPEQFPKTVDTLEVLAPPTGAVQEHQILVPIAIDPTIDRIRIERVSGSGILIEAKLIREGCR